MALGRSPPVAANKLAEETVVELARNLSEQEIIAVISGIDSDGWQEATKDYKFLHSSAAIRAAVENFRLIAQDPNSLANMLLFLGLRLGRLAATKELLTLPK